MMCDRITWAAGAILIFALITGGCGDSAGVKRFNVVVELDERLRDPATRMMPSFEMDLVGLGDGDDLARNMPVSEYFRSTGDGAELRADMDATGQKVTWQFDDDDPGPRTLSIRDEIWDVWEQKNYPEMMVIVDALPGATDDGARRLFIPLDQRRWTSGQGNRITITVQRSRLTYSPLPDAD